MGNGIAQVFAQAGFSVKLVDVAPPMLDRARASIEKSLAKFVDKGKLTASDRDATIARLSTATTVDQLERRRLCRRSDRRRRGREACALCEPRRHHQAGRDSRVEHVLDLHHRARRGDPAPGQSPRHALHEPGAAHDAGRDDSRPGHISGVHEDCLGPVRHAREDAGRGRRLSGVHREPHPDADDQRGDLRGDGGRRHARRRSTR